MKKLIYGIFTLCLLVTSVTLAQTKKKTTVPLARLKPMSVETIAKPSHVGTWKLITQKVTYSDGGQYMGDSSMVFQRKIITPTTFVVVIEKKIKELDNKKMVTSTAGGHYKLVDGNYEELTEYATFQGFETMKVNYVLTVDGNTLHTIGTVGDMIYDETYIRED
jgi:hypothetical protein